MSEPPKQGPADNPASSILESLNKAQYEAVTSKADTVAILAGPGSGKTHTLTSRVVWLIREAGYVPSNVIVATFTVKAAREMRERVGKVLGEECRKKIILGTFHSIARRFLASYGKLIGLDPKFGIADDGDSKAMMTRICKRLQSANVTVDPAHARSWISKRKSKGISFAPRPEDKKNPQFASLIACYEEYQDTLERSNLLDYDDLLIKCVELLRKHPQCVNNIESVLIDEYQDTNGIQYQLMKLFAQAKQRITVVGDPDQSIYGWRSAEIQNLHRLLREFPETDEISLEENYRSSSAILTASLRVIQQDKSRYEKVLLPVHEKGTSPVLRTLNSGFVEGQWIVSEIQRIGKMTGGMIKNQDIAILVRSAFLSRHTESALGKAGIQYRMIGGSKFYERKEIKILVDYLRAANQPHTNDVIARIINVPKRGIGEKTVKALVDEAEQAKISLWTLLVKHCNEQRKASTTIRPVIEKKISSDFIRIVATLQRKAEHSGDGPGPLVELVHQLIGMLNFESFLKTEYPDDHEQRWLNVQEFINLATDFVRDFDNLSEGDLPELEEVEQTDDEGMLGKFLANIALASDAQKDDANADQSSVLTISTIHAAKGLEWPVVFIPAVNDGSIPHSRSEDHDEERRLLYVAMTRAKAFLYLTYPAMGPQGNAAVDLSNFVSPFATAVFAPKGPSFNDKALREAGKILGRDVPTQEVIYANLPEMFHTEDDRIPVDPNSHHDQGAEDKYDGYRRYSGGHKRKGSDFTTEPLRGEKRSLLNGQVPTMQKASSFTMPSAMSGFVSAGAHQSTLVADAERSAKAEDVAKQEQKAAARRGPGQTSLHGFVVQQQQQETPTAPTQPYAGGQTIQPFQRPLNGQGGVRPVQASRQNSHSLPSATNSYFRPPAPTIDASLKGHQLRGQARPQPNRMQVATEAARQHYANFSSSPQRPPSPVQAQAPPVPVPGYAPPKQTSFHTTTFQAAKAGAGVRRPAGMGPAPAMDKLRRPFKPLTINRPGQPPKN